MPLLLTKVEFSSKLKRKIIKSEKEIQYVEVTLRESAFQD